MLTTLGHVGRLARAGFVLAREGVFSGIDLRAMPVEARLPLALAQLIARPRVAEAGNRRRSAAPSRGRTRRR